ncbi:MAG: hypothetical protein QM698_11505 [Micropepsaceae bacterium]
MMTTREERMLAVRKAAIAILDNGAIAMPETNGVATRLREVSDFVVIETCIKGWRVVDLYQNGARVFAARWHVPDPEKPKKFFSMECCLWGDPTWHRQFMHVREQFGIGEAV